MNTMPVGDSDLYAYVQVGSMRQEAHALAVGRSRRTPASLLVFDAIGGKW